MPPSEQRLWALVCGRASNARQRNFMVLQAYIDDSGTDGEVLILAGFIADVATWARFSADWQEILDMRPPWKSFKAAEAARLSGDESRERTKFFFKVIDRHLKNFVAVSVDVAAIDRAIDASRIPREVIGEGLQNPYMWALRVLPDGLAQHQRAMGLHHPVDFIFDERGEERWVRESWDQIKRLMKREAAQLLGEKPRFENDEHFLPLQAADLFAWHVRKSWISNRSIIDKPIELPWAPQRGMRGQTFSVNYDFLVRQLHAIAWKLVGDGVLEPYFSLDLEVPE